MSIFRASPPARVDRQGVMIEVDGDRWLLAIAGRLALEVQLVLDEAFAFVMLDGEPVWELDQVWARIDHGGNAPKQPSEGHGGRASQRPSKSR